MKSSSPPKVLCIIGSGVQARSHAEALRLIHDFEEVLNYHNCQECIFVFACSRGLLFVHTPCSL